MIRADKRGPRAWLWARYVDWRLWRAFRGTWVRGELPAAQPGTGVLAYCNHVSFWDGFAAHALARVRRWDAHCVMEEQNLARYPFLRRLGAFSIRRGDAASALETLRYARALLRAGAAVFIFPEGTWRPGASDLGPLERGVEVLARASGATCVPVALRYVFLDGERPDLLAQAGEAHAPGPLDQFRERLAAALQSVNAARGVEGFQRV